MAQWTMLTWRHSVVVTDLKREIFELTAGWRGTERARPPRPDTGRGGYRQRIKSKEDRRERNLAASGFGT